MNSGKRVAGFSCLGAVGIWGAFLSKLYSQTTIKKMDEGEHFYRFKGRKKKSHSLQHTHTWLFTPLTQLGTHSVPNKKWKEKKILALGQNESPSMQSKCSLMRWEKRKKKRKIDDGIPIQRGKKMRKGRTDLQKHAREMFVPYQALHRGCLFPFWPFPVYMRARIALQGARLFTFLLIIKTEHTALCSWQKPR